MKIHVAHHGQKLGPFALEEVRSKLASGELHTADLAWYEGAPDWVPIVSLPELNLSVSEPPAVPPPRMISPPPASPLAMASMVLGIISLTLFPLLPGIPAVICGHLSLRDIRRSAGAVGGHGLAVVGLVTGYISVAVMALLLVGLSVFFGFAASHRGNAAPRVESHQADHSTEPELPTR